MSSLLRLERKQKNYSNSFSNSQISISFLFIFVLDVASYISIKKTLKLILFVKVMSREGRSGFQTVILLPNLYT